MPDGDVPVAATPVAPMRVRRQQDVQKFVATFVLVTFLGIVMLICWHVVPDQNKDALEIMIGVVAGSYKDIIQFFFGSTSASHEKDATIGALASNAAPPAGTP